MKTTLPLILTTAAICQAGPDEGQPLSYLPAEGIGQLIVDKLDLSSFRNILGPRRLTGQVHFADLGIKPVSVSDEFVDMSDDSASFTIRVLERRDQNGDGIEDLMLRIADSAKEGTYSSGQSLLVSRYSPDGKLIALAYEPTEPEPAKAAPPAPDSPAGVVAALYEAHASGNSPLFQTQDRARLDQFFTKALADLLWKEAHHPAGELGALSADPLIDAQDGEPRLLEFIADEPEAGKVLVTASFHLLGEPCRIRFRMQQEDGAWKCADILGRDFSSLRETLEEAYPSQPNPKD